MRYAEYSDYVSVFEGNILSSTDFAVYEVKASRYIDYVTYNKIKKVTIDVVLAVCAIAEYLYQSDKSQVTSESVGSYSVSYENSGHADTKYDIAREYLANSGLMYRGLM